MIFEPLALGKWEVEGGAVFSWEGITPMPFPEPKLISLAMVASPPQRREGATDVPSFYFSNRLIFKTNFKRRKGEP